MNTDTLIRRLERPTHPVDVVLDTDTFNEVDDQFALSYLVKNADKLRLKAIHAAPFFNDKSSGSADGMEKSYHEIHHILELLGREDLKPLAFRGSDRFLPSEEEAVPSPAAENLVRLAMEYGGDTPLYVVAIGAITNVASALLMKPEIAERIVLIWLGGNALHWHDNREFNLGQDIAAARIVFGCGVPLVQLPCQGVVSAFTTSGPELEHWLRGKNALCEYLADITIEEGLRYSSSPCWTRVIWDVTAVAWLLHGDCFLDRLEHSPIPTYDHRYALDSRRHFIRQVYSVDRDKLYAYLFERLGE
jgi:inosine-uridine nucleoside N-ribohydrolase